ncbi:MAG: UvrD-helicase domain-containing protein [Roseibacillus sp.]
MNPSIEFTSASAGSGKTYRLVEIVSEAILDGSARPQGIVATTFTVAAANELRERLSAKFYETDRHTDAVLLRSGMIGTVHGICLDLLSRFSLEAGLSPEVTILDDNQSKELLSRAFDAILTGDDEQQLYQLSKRLSQVDPQSSTHNFHSVIPSIVNNARSNDIDPTDLPKTGKDSWEEMKAALPAPSKDDLDKELADAIKCALKELDPNAKANVVQTYRQLLQQCLRALDNEGLDWSHWNKLTTASPGKAQANLAIALPVQEAASRLGEHPRFHEDQKSYLSLLFKKAQHLAESFGQLKRERGVADFADLEKEALDLLTNSEEVRSILSAEIDLLVVDEFQDTSPIQLALFSRLAECAKRVVWVGDVKQAIYGFRGSDPELIISAVAGATKTPPLDLSWRSAPDLVHFVNGFFAKPFEESLGLPPEEVTLTPHRETHAEASPALRIAKVTSGEQTAKGLPKKTKNEHRIAATADAIQVFLDSDEKVIDKNSITPQDPVGSLRPVTPRDLAILVRTGKNASDLADDLRARGIDVSLSTSGLLTTPECQLALACLRVLVDSRDSLASAEVIALEASHAPESWLSDRFEYLKQRAENPPGESSKAWGRKGTVSSPSIDALLTIRDEHNLATLSPLALYDLAHTAADVPSLASAWGPTQQRAEQRFANLSRLRELVQEYQTAAHSSAAPATLNGLFVWLDDLADDFGSKEAKDKRPIDPEIDSVHIGTYHGAKGLEWPVVFACDLDSKTRSRLFTLRQLSESAKLDFADPLAGRTLRLWINPFGKSKSQLVDDLEASPVGQQSEQNAQSEELRLLYVGFTRARDTLVLVNDPATTPEWLDLTSAGDFLKAENSPFTLGEHSLPLTTSTQIYEPFVSLPPPAPTIQLPVRAPSQTSRLPLHITPSSREPIAGAIVTETIEFGTALQVPSRINARDYGDAMHRIIAAEIQNPNHPDRNLRAERLLTHWDLQESISTDEILTTVDTYRKWIEDTFNPTQQLIEVPFTHTTPDGQQATGFIDHLVITPDGPIIIDHKIYPGPKSTWDETALSYSGQLALYRQFVSTIFPGQKEPECWIHFASHGASLKVEIPSTSLS